MALSAPLRPLLQLGAALAVAVSLPPAGFAGTPAGESPGPANTATLGEAIAPSTAEQKQLGEHLRRLGALFYGAWWCPHCFHQKNLFGQEAGNALPYVECDKSDAGRERCAAAGIRAYPTWELKGERREGLLSLEELKAWSGFRPGTP